LERAFYRNYASVRGIQALRCLEAAALERAFYRNYASVRGIQALRCLEAAASAQQSD
jgi:hypothetical protein